MDKFYPNDSVCRTIGEYTIIYRLPTFTIETKDLVAMSVWKDNKTFIREDSPHNLIPFRTYRDLCKVESKKFLELMEDIRLKSNDVRDMREFADYYRHRNPPMMNELEDTLIESRKIYQQYCDAMVAFYHFMT